MLSAYDGVKMLAKEHPDWLRVVKGCYEIAAKYDKFAGAWVVDEIGWFPSLRLLAKYGVLVKQGESTRGGRRAYYSMPDREGVGMALRELGVGILKTFERQNPPEISRPQAS